MDNIVADAMRQGPLEQEHQCDYCNKKFSKESTLVHHMCEPKRRQLQKNEPGVRIGYSAYLKFYDLAQPGKKKKSYEEFAKSPYYKAFVKYGRWCLSINAIAIEHFTDWILRSGIKLDYWCKDKNYDKFLLEFLKKEDVCDALTRSITTMEKWGQDRNCPFNDYFRYGNANRICQEISVGKISPWAIYCSDSGIEWLSNLNEDQLNSVYEWIDPDAWKKIIAKYPEEREWCKQVFDEAGI